MAVPWSVWHIHSMGLPGRVPAAQKEADPPWHHHPVGRFEGRQSQRLGMGVWNSSGLSSFTTTSVGHKTGIMFFKLVT